MKNRILPLLFRLLFPLLFSMPSRAELYLEASLESGGDTLARSSLGDELNAGGGVKLAIGTQNWLDDAGSSALRLSVGYLWDDVSGSNGSAELEALTFDALYLIHSGPHSFGVGAAWQASPRYRIHVDGVNSRIDYQDTVGPVIQYSYRFSPGLELGFRFSDLEYEAESGGERRDAGSFGVYLSNGF